ncbi:MAG: putative Ig domain-containing protein [Planctomycetota bacterium]|nr:putative Ig domain-containing protein [Planctomycetota bacterium]
MTNNDSATLSINDVTQFETDSGATTYTFTVTLSAAVDTGVSFDFASANNTATTADSDYTGISITTRNFASTMAGATETVTVQVNGDQKVELDETFFVNLSNIAAGGRDVTFADSQGLGTITNDDSATLSIDDVTQSETDAGATAYTFTVTLDTEVDTGISFDFATANDTATTADSDYTGISTTRSFGSTVAGATETITVQVNGDAKVELDETFFLNLSGISAAGRDVTFADNQGLGTINNDDSATISINDVSLIEGDVGTTAYTFTVTLDAEVDLDVTLDFSTATIANAAEDETGSTAANLGGKDFTSKSSSVTFAANGGANQTQSITIDVNGDSIGELDEGFHVNLSNVLATGRDVTFADSQGTGTIVNDDIAVMQINDVVVQEGDLGVSPFVFNITFDKIVSRNFTVDYATEDVSTTVGNDYTSLSGTLSFAAGDTSATLIVDVTGDRAIEDTESFILRFSNLSDTGVAFAGGGTSMGGVATVINDDFSQQLITTSSLSVNTGGSPNAISITDPDTGQTLTVTPFASNFAGGSNVTTGDFNFDGRADIIAAAKAGGGPHVQVFNSSGALFLEFMAYDINFMGGVNVAAADFNRDGVADILTGPGPGGGPHVKVFDGTNPDNLLFDQIVYTSTFLGGVNVAAGDVTGDGIPDIITGPGAGGGPNVKVFDGVTGAVVKDFFAYDLTFMGGVFVGAGDFNGDRFADIVTGAGPGGGPHTRVYSGQDLTILQDFFAYDAAFSGGVAVTAADLNGDGVDDVIVGPSDGSTGVGRQVFDGATGRVITSITPTELGTGPIATSSSAMTPNGNISPYVVNSPTDVSLAAGKSFNWTVPTNTFFDENVGDTLTLSAYSGNGAALPTWLSFDSGTSTFSGTPGTGDVDISNVRIVADDGNLGTSSTFFNINVGTAANPVKPSVTSPAANGTVTDLTPTFVWTDDPNVAMFDLSVVELDTGDEVIRQKTLTKNSFTATINLAEGDYDVRVRGKNLAGVYSMWSAPHTITIDINVPAKPVPLTPTGTINDATPTFTWTQDANTDNVEISIVDTSSGTEVFRQKNIAGATSFTIPAANALAADTYHFNMQAFNELNKRSGWTSRISFTVALGVPTTAPQITSPMAATTTDSTPAFAWQSVVNATRYNLVVTDTTTSTVIINEVGLSTTSFTPSTPIVNGTYSVVVTGTNEVGTAGPSSTAKLVTIAAAQPARPVIVAPGATTPNTRPTFAWTPGADIVEYQLWLSERATPSVAFIRLTALTDTIATATKDLPPGDYSVWIKAINVNGTHNWSLEHQFTVNFDVVALDSESTPHASDTAHEQSSESATLIGIDELVVSLSLELSLEGLVPTPTDDATNAQPVVEHAKGEHRQMVEPVRNHESDLPDWLDQWQFVDGEVNQADSFFAQDELVTALLMG